jgi:hypothetical protein
MNYTTKYDGIFERAKHWWPEWVEIDPDDVAGKFSGQKQTSIMQAAKGRGIKIRTSYMIGYPFLIQLDRQVGQ